MSILFQDLSEFHHRCLALSAPAKRRFSLKRSTCDLALQRVSHSWINDRSWGKAEHWRLAAMNQDSASSQASRVAIRLAWLDGWFDSSKHQKIAVIARKTQEKKRLPFIFRRVQRSSACHLSTVILLRMVESAKQSDLKPQGSTVLVFSWQRSFF
eukprot:scaffold13_cov241-Pinguiococcus_pyrenoidosus.AAC.19